MTTVVKQERLVAINPTRSCAPIGAMLSTFGIHGAITINHGSQGCATYPRHQMARHFREPVEVATTSLTEKTTVYGGKENLLAALKNIWDRFHPTMITVCSTCLSETIGDDIPGIIEEFQDKHPDVDIPILSVRTPSYIGTHITGFDNFLKELATRIPARRKKGDSNGKINLIPGWVNPGDLRELRDILREMDVAATFLTDYADTLDGGYYNPRPHVLQGGTTLAEVQDSSRALATIALQAHVGGEAAKVYKRKHNVPAHILPMPIGLANTDKFLETVAEVTGKPIPEALQVERARLLDAIVDTHIFNTGLKVGIFGDPDIVYGMVRLVAEMGMVPRYAVTATDSKAWGDDMAALAEELGLDNLDVVYRSDLYELHKRMKEDPVDVVIGHSKGKFLADAEKIPLVRVGFPVEDRFGYHRRAIVGYEGAIYLVDEITNLLLAQRGNIVSNTLLAHELNETPDPVGGGCGQCGGG
jgi:nitrogenase molybdenum-iron protein beta chain